MTAPNGTAHPRPGGPASEPECALFARLAHLADLLVEARETVRQVAEEAQDQLAVRAKRALMDDVTRTATNVPAPRRKLLTVTDIAGIVGCRPRTVRRWREEGRLPPALHFGGLVRWEETDVLAWLDTCKEAKR